MFSRCPKTLVRPIVIILALAGGLLLLSGCDTNSDDSLPAVSSPATAPLSPTQRAVIISTATPSVAGDSPQTNPVPATTASNRTTANQSGTKDAAATAPNDPAVAANNQGVDLLAKGQAEAALQNLDKAVQLNPGVAQFWNNRGLALQALGRSDEALDSYRKALALQPNYKTALYDEGVLLYGQARYDEAAGTLEQTTRLDQKCLDCWQELGMTRYQQGQLGPAEQAFSQALALAGGGDDQLLYYRGLVRSDNGQYQAALADFEGAITYGLKNDETLYFKGLMLYKLHRYQEAVAALTEVTTRLNPKHAQAYYILAYAYAALGQSGPANQAFEQGYKLEPPVTSAQ